MAYEVGTVTRNYLGDYLSAVVDPEVYSLLGLGVVQIDESLNPKLDKTPFVNNINVSGTVTGYERTFPFDAQLRSGETAIMMLHDISRTSKIGTEAELYYTRVDLYETPGVDGLYPARRFKVAVEISSIEGAGTEIVRVKGNMHQIGDATEGFFDVDPLVLEFSLPV